MTMTYSSSGPSLAQAQHADPDDSYSRQSLAASDSHSDTHSQSNIHSHRNYNPHNYDHQDQKQNHIRHARRNSRHAHGRLHHLKRQEVDVDAAGGHELTATQSHITKVIQTVSLVQVVDSTGSPIELQTHYGTPNTIVVDSSSGSTIAVSNPDPSSTAAVPASVPVASDNVPLESSPSAVAAATADASPSSPQSLPSTIPDSDVSQSVPSSDDTLSALLVPSAPGSDSAGQASTLTSPPSQPSDPVSAFVGLSGSQNSTSTLISGTSSVNSTTLTELTSSDTSLMKALVFATSESDSSTTASTSSTSTRSSVFSSEQSSTWTSSTIYSTISTEYYISTAYGDLGGGYETVAPVPQPTETTSEGATEGVLTPQEKQVIGGVVGSVAGVAFLVLLALLLWRRRRRQGGGGLLGFGRPGTASRSVTDGGSSAAMTERSGPFAVTAALASLTGKRSTQTAESSAGGERGFYRVSGKKLPSVLQAGGDGYTDPRESVQSGHTEYWRGSQAFEPAGGASTRLALGTPMRPVSGVPIMRTGPARTPITEQNPFEDPPPAPRPDSDALGRSLVSQDGSRGSTSRFHERI